MHPNPAFRVDDAARNLAFAKQRGFGVLTVVAEEEVLASHIPFLISDDGIVAAHLAMGNPTRLLLKGGARKAKLIITGPDGYVSPDWYGDPEQVPTWNYVAVHLTGRVSLLPQEKLTPHLAAVTEAFEDRLDKTPWKMDKVPEDALKRLLRMIAPIEMTIEAVEGTWKLNQNKTPAARDSAATRIAVSPAGIAVEELARLMSLVGVED